MARFIKLNETVAHHSILQQSLASHPNLLSVIPGDLGGGVARGEVIIVWWSLSFLKVLVLILNSIKVIRGELL